MQTGDKSSLCVLRRSEGIVSTRQLDWLGATGPLPLLSVRRYHAPLGTPRHRPTLTVALRDERSVRTYRQRCCIRVAVQVPRFRAGARAARVRIIDAPRVRAVPALWVRGFFVVVLWPQSARHSI